MSEWPKMTDAPLSNDELDGVSYEEVDFADLARELYEALEQVRRDWGQMEHLPYEVSPGTQSQFREALARYEREVGK